MPRIIREQRDQRPGLLVMERLTQGFQKSVDCKLVLGAACLLIHFKDGLLLTEWAAQAFAPDFRNCPINRLA